MPAPETIISKPPGRWPRPAVWIFLGALLCRLLVLARFTDSSSFLPAGGDMQFYNDWAQRILHGVWTDHQAFYGLPGYAFILAGLYKIAGYNPFVPGLLQCALEAGTATFIFLLGRLLACRQDGRPIRPTALLPAILAAAGYTLFVPAISYSIILMPTPWVVCAYWGTVYALLKADAASVWKPWLGLGTLIGAVATVIATILFLIPFGLAIILSRFWKQPNFIPKSLVAAFLLFAGVVLGTSPCWIHNYFIAGEPVLLSAHSGLNFYIGNSPGASGYPKMPAGMSAGQEGMLHDSITMAERAVGHPLKRVEVSRYWTEKARANIAANPWAWLRLLVTKIRNFWNAFQYDDLSIITLLRENGVTPPGLRFGLVAVFGLVGAGVACWKNSRAGWIVAAILLHLAALLPVFVTERYRLTAVPGLLLLGAIGLGGLWRWLATAQWKPAVLFTAATCVSAWAIATPPADPGLWSLDLYNSGIDSLSLNELDRADHSLRVAYRYSPESAEINFALGNLALARSDERRAQICYVRTLTLNPAHDGALNNLGVIAFQHHDFATAERLLTRAVRIEPGDAKRHFLLAQIALQQKHWPEATLEIDAALRLRPERPEFQQLKTEIDAAQAAPPGQLNLR